MATIENCSAPSTYFFFVLFCVLVLFFDFGQIKLMIVERSLTFCEVKILSLILSVD